MYSEFYRKVFQIMIFVPKCFILWSYFEFHHFWFFSSLMNFLQEDLNWKNSYNLGEEEILQVSCLSLKSRSNLKLHMGNVHPKELKNLLLKENLELAISSINDDSHTTLGIMSTKNSRKLQKKEDPNMLFLLLLLPSCWWWWKNLFMMMTFFDENIQGGGKKNGLKVNIGTT